MEDNLLSRIRSEPDFRAIMWGKSLEYENSAEALTKALSQGSQSFAKQPSEKQQFIIDQLFAEELKGQTQPPTTSFEPVQQLPPAPPAVGGGDVPGAAALAKGGAAVIDAVGQTFADPTTQWSVALPTMAAILAAVEPTMLGELGLMGYAGLAGLGATIGESNKIVDEALQNKLETEVYGPYYEGLATRIGTAGLWEGGIDYAAALAISPFALGAKYMKNQVSPLAKTMIKTMRDMGVNIPMAHLADFRPLDIVNNMVGGSWSGQVKMADHVRNLITAKVDFVKGILDYTSEAVSKMDPRDAGEVLADVLTRGQDASKVIEQEMFKVIDELDAAGTMVDIIPVYKSLLPLREQFANIGDVGFEGSVKNFFNGIENAIKQTAGNPDAGTVGFRDAQLLRSLLADIRRSKDFQPGKKVFDKAYAQAIEVLDEQMEISAKLMRPEAAKTWRKANQVFKKNLDKFNSDMARSIYDTIKHKPKALEQVIHRITEAGDAQAVRELQQLVFRAARDAGVPVQDAWKPIKRQYMVDLFERASLEKGLEDPVRVGVLRKVTDPEEPGIIQPKKLLSLLNDRRFRHINGAFLGAHTMNNMRRFAEAAAVAGAKQPGGATVVMQLMQAGALLGAGTIVGTDYAYKVFGKDSSIPEEVKTKALITAGALLLGPHVVARMLQSRRATNWLIKGFKEPVGTQRAIAVLSRIAGYALMSGTTLTSAPSAEEEYGMYDDVFMGVAP